MARASRSFPTSPVIPEGGVRPEAKVPVGEILRGILEHPGMKANLAHVVVREPVEARFGEWPAALAPELAAALAARGIARPYSHQSEAMEHALAGRHAVVVTPTASGKSLCYNVPVVQSILEDGASRALYLFPTKALSHDQYRGVHELTQACGRDIKVYTYDGDTPPATRRALRDSGHIVVTNPDMLHSGILPHHTGWVRLFENLRHVVIDELHHYRGVFGSHLANVLRRLVRLCTFYGSRPTFLCSSATIANPRELAEQLTGLPFEVVAESGAPQGRKTFVFYNPPVINAELNVRRSPRLEARRIAMRFLASDHQVIVFGRSRLDVEVMTTYLKRGMTRAHRDEARVTGYRSGYLPTERRAIEQGLKKRDLLGVVSTNALELGVDIGGLDVSILAGWPGTIASAWQQAGRAGRSHRDSVVFYIGGSSALDQFLMQHPDFFFGRSPEAAMINPENLAILSSHLRCAAFELPFDDGESFGPADPAPVLQFLEDEKVVRHSGGRWHYSSDVYPAQDVSLRSGSGENFIVLDTGNANAVIAEVDYDSAPFLLHDDAVYIHNGRTYLVEKLDWDRRTAFVRHRVVDYYTDAEASSNVQVLQVDEDEAGARLGSVSVATEIARFKKVKFESQESIGYGPVTLPQLEIQTEAAWLMVPEGATARLKADGLLPGPALAGLAHLLRGVVPLFVLCDPADFSTMAMVRSTFDRVPAVYLWDRHPGGIGIARRFFQVRRAVLAAARQRARECTCQHGCPACVGAQLDAKSRAREGAMALLDYMVGELSVSS